MDWSEQERDIRAFFSRARRIQARGEGPPKVVIVGGAAVVAGVSRFEFTFADGETTQNRAATTMVLRRGKAGWRVIHDHFSAAVDPASR